MRIYYISVSCARASVASVARTLSLSLSVSGGSGSGSSWAGWCALQGRGRPLRPLTAILTTLLPSQPSLSALPCYWSNTALPSQAASPGCPGCHPLCCQSDDNLDWFQRPDFTISLGHRDILQELSERKWSVKEAKKIWFDYYGIWAIFRHARKN